MDEQVTVMEGCLQQRFACFHGGRHSCPAKEAFSGDAEKPKHWARTNALWLVVACVLAMPGPVSASVGETVERASYFRKGQWDSAVDTTFRSHSFGAYCYRTRGCRVAYNGHMQIDQKPGELSPPMKSAPPMASWGGGSIGIDNFPSPARVEWTSSDGVPHRAEIDMAAIFPDQMVVTDVDRSKVRENAFAGDPTIVLVVDDRRISVYSKAMIPLREPQDPGNRYSAIHDGTVLVYVRSF